MKESRCNEGQHSWKWGGGSRSYVSWHKLIFQPSPSLMQQNRVRQSSLYLKVLPQLWSFPFSGNVSLQRGSGLIWDDVLGHVVLALQSSVGMPAVHVLRHSGKISSHSGYCSKGNVLLHCPGTLPAWKGCDINSSHNTGFCPLPVTQMIFSYEWKWKSKWEETKSPTKTPFPKTLKCGSI